MVFLNFGIGLVADAVVLTIVSNANRFLEIRKVMLKDLALRINRIDLYLIISINMHVSVI